MSDSPKGKLEWMPDLNLWESDHILIHTAALRRASLVLWMKNRDFFPAKFDYDGDKTMGYEITFHKPF